MPGPQAYIALVDANGNLLSVNSPLVLPGGRLTLTTAVPVLSAAVSASANVLYTPYLNNYIPIWSGSVWQPTTFAELTNVLANSSVGNAGPAAGAAAKNYDLFVWNSSGTLYLTRGGAWNSDTVRSATTENDLQRVQGVLCNLNAITNGPAAGFGTYVGTVRTDAGGATVTFNPATVLSTSSLGAWCGVWNMYNRMYRSFRHSDDTATWNYTSNTIRVSDNSSGNRFSFVRGLDEESMDCQFAQQLTTAAAASALGKIGIGLDSTTAFSGLVGPATVKTVAAVTNVGLAIAPLSGQLGLGFHFVQMLEQGDNTNATQFGGNTQNSLLVGHRF